MSQFDSVRQRAQQRFDATVSADPMGIDRYASKSPSPSYHKNQIYMCLVAIPLLLIVGIIFFMIASIDGALFGTPDDEINSIIDSRVQSMMENVANDNGG